MLPESIAMEIFSMHLHFVLSFLHSLYIMKMSFYLVHFVIACQISYFETKKRSAHLNTYHSNDTNRLNFMLTQCILTNQKRSMQLQPSVHFWGSPTLYKPPSIQLQLIKATMVICMSFANLGQTLTEDTYPMKHDVNKQRKSHRCQESDVIWWKTLLLCDKVHTCIYFLFVIFFYNCDTITTPT